MRVIIDGKKCDAEYGEYILNVARRNGVNIPALCHSDALPGQGNCRMCIVEIVDKGKKRIVASCAYPITGEIEIVTNSERIYRIRKTIVRLLSASAPDNEYIKRLKKEYDIPPETRFKVDRDGECILCGLCVRACDEIGVSAISTVNRGTTKRVSTPFDEPSTVCIGCGTCAYICPTEWIKVNEDEGRRVIWNKTFELLKCSECGEYFITREQYEYIKKRYDLADTNELLCDKCKKKGIGDKLTNVLHNVIPVQK
jgi:NADH dehydrogenase/NADH:ubiquinone oxidoreductase subunit G